MPTDTPTDTHRPATGYVASAGRGVKIIVTARCTCGWVGISHRWGPSSGADTAAQLDTHVSSSGHQPIASADCLAFGVHPRCAHLHRLEDDCPVSYDSPAGHLARTVQSTLGHPDAAADRLAAAQALADWADSQVVDAVIGSRINGLTYAEIDNATRSSSHPRRRWQPLLDRLEPYLPG